MLFSAILLLVAPKQPQPSAWRAGGRSGGQVPGHNFAQHFFLCPTSMAQCSRMSETQKASRKKHNKNTTKRQLRTKWPRSTPNSEHEVWSFHTAIIRLKMVTALHMSQFQKPLVQANGCIQYHVAMQCAFSVCFSQWIPTYVPSLGPLPQFLP